MTQTSAPARLLLTPDDRSIAVQLASAFHQPWALLLVGAVCGEVVAWAAFMLGLR